MDERRQRVVWTLLLAIPPGAGVTGFASVGLNGGRVTPISVGAGLATSLIIALFFLLVFTSGSEPEENEVVQ